MLTPDAGLIRVRWYRVPEPPDGVPWDSGPYAHSDWDVTKDIDPALGEQSSLRRPYDDYRSCEPPPWVDPPIVACADAHGPAWPCYRFRSNAFNGPFLVPTDGGLNGSHDVEHVGGCLWRTADVPTGRIWQLRFTADGGAEVKIDGRRADGEEVVFTFLAPPPVDPHGPIRAFLANVDSPGFTGPAILILRSCGGNVLDTESGLVLANEDGDELAY